MRQPRALIILQPLDNRSLNGRQFHFIHHQSILQTVSFPIQSTQHVVSHSPFQSSTHRFADCSAGWHELRIAGGLRVELAREMDSPDLLSGWVAPRVLPGFPGFPRISSP
jgi:hypothetical protein